MALLAGTTYDPATIVAKATSALLAMTALDTTNLRLTFTAPANGIVLVRMRGSLKGATTSPQILLGVLDGATVKGRQAPISGRLALGTANNLLTVESLFLVTGLTSGTSYTYDAAYGVEVVVAASVLGYGGPNNTTASDAQGGFAFEIWETGTLLAGTLYDPATAVSKATSALLAMTAFDTTNLRLTFTAPASGDVLVKIRCMDAGAATAPMYLLGVLDGATVKGRAAPVGGVNNVGTPLASTQNVREAVFLVTGLTPSTSYTYDAAYSVETIAAATNIKYGGPNDTTTDNAYGGVAYEIWTA